MKHYQIVIDADIPIIGKYPQVKGLKIDFHKARASQWGIIGEWKTDDDIPDLHNFLFQRGAKLTDIVTNSFVNITSGIFISEKAKNVLESFAVNGNFYPITIYKGEEKKSYSFLRYEFGAINEIDFNSSEFMEYNRIEKKIGDTIFVNDFEDYKNKLKQFRASKESQAGWGFYEKKITFKKYFDITPASFIGLICNENVKKAIEENQLTGFEFRPIDVEIRYDNFSSQ